VWETCDKKINDNREQSDYHADLRTVAIYLRNLTGIQNTMKKVRTKSDTISTLKDVSALKHNNNNDNDNDNNNNNNNNNYN